MLSTVWKCECILIGHWQNLRFSFQATKIAHCLCKFAFHCHNVRLELDNNVIGMFPIITAHRNANLHEYVN